MAVSDLVDNAAMIQSQLDRWRPALRRAVMKVRPEYFGWSREARERYGVAIPQDDQARLDRALLAELFGRKARSAREAERAAERLSLADQNLWNEVILPLVGVGEDSFYLNEWLGEGESVLDFASLRDFDADNYRFQEDVREKEDPAYARKPYRGSLHFTWARMFVDERFTYATLSMVAAYLASDIGSHAADLIEEKIPHRYVPGKDHGKVDGECLRWDMRVDAGGKEALLDALRDRVFEYERERHEALVESWHVFGRGGVFVLDESEPPESNLHFVFTDIQALAGVRFHAFVRDTCARALPRDELDRCRDVERNALRNFVDEQYESLRRSVDPAVIRLRRRRRVMVHKNAFDDLR